MGKYFIAILLSVSIVPGASANDREDAVCGIIQEPLHVLVVEFCSAGS